MESAGCGEILDGTVGGGGHARALLERYPECRVLGVDRDPAALRSAGAALAPFGDRVRLVEGSFDDVAQELRAHGERISGALLDLGVSGHQLDVDARGFTFRPGAPLDMRMGGEGSGERTAADLLNEEDEGALLRIFREWGEEPRARRLARAVVLLRGDRPFRTSDHLVEAMAKAYGRPPTPQDRARIFQALRMEVNREMDALDRALPAIREALLPGGVVAVIAWHSLEDRRVKAAFREWSEGCICPPALPICGCGRKPEGELLTRKAVKASPAEVESNPRARSARLRVWRKAA